MWCHGVVDVLVHVVDPDSRALALVANGATGHAAVVIHCVSLNE